MMKIQGKVRTFKIILNINKAILRDKYLHDVQVKFTFNKPVLIEAISLHCQENVITVCDTSAGSEKKKK